MLTDRQIQKMCKPGMHSAGRDAFGLRIRVHKASDGTLTKSWVQRVFADGRQRSIGLGSWPLISAEDAWATAFDNKRAAMTGSAPATTTTTKETPTVAECFGRYIEANPTFSKSTSNGWRSTLRKHVEPAIGGRMVHTITTGDVKALVDPIWHETPSAAKQLLSRVETVFDDAIAHGERTDNPVPAIRKSMPRQGTTTTNRKSVPHAELADALDTISNGKGGDIAKLALRMVVLTVARPHLVRGMTWDEIEAGDDGLWTWTIPASRMKTRHAHSVPLPAEAVRVLRAADKLAPPSGDDALVFPGTKGEMADKTLTRLLKGSGIEADVHGFRASFRTWCAETGVNDDLRRAAMAHKLGDDATDSAYLRTQFVEQRRPLMEAWADHLSG